jgi:hypothetical protein
MAVVELQKRDDQSSRSREENASGFQTDFSCSGTTNLFPESTAIAVAQIFPTATRKFAPRGTIPVAYRHKHCVETIGTVRAAEGRA